MSTHPLTSVALLCAFAALCAAAAHAQRPAQDRESVAVLAVTLAGAPPEDAARITHRLRETLAATARFAPLPTERARAGVPLPQEQEAACADAECAAAVGRRLGVAQVVVAHGMRVPPHAWQLKVELVEVETGQTLLARTLYLEGELSALLSDGVPRLARALAGESEDAAEPPVQPPAEPRPPSRGSTARTTPESLRLAILPAWAEGPLRDEALRRYREQMGRLAETEPEGRRLVIAYAPFALPGVAVLPDADALADRVWLGSGLGGRPDVSHARRVGHRLGVQAVILVRLIADRRDVVVQVWVVDVATGESAREVGRAPAERLADTLRERTRRAVRVYRERYAPVLRQAGQGTQ